MVKKKGLVPPPRSLTSPPSGLAPKKTWKTRRRLPVTRLVENRGRRVCEEGRFGSENLTWSKKTIPFLLRAHSRAPPRISHQKKSGKLADACRLPDWSRTVVGGYVKGEFEHSNLSPARRGRWPVATGHAARWRSEKSSHRFHIMIYCFAGYLYAALNRTAATSWQP